MYSTIKKLPKCEKVEGDDSIEPDYDLLTSLLYQQTPSRSKEQDKFLEWIQLWLIEQGVEYISTTDMYGNLYITKGESDLYPCVVAHVDINQEWKKEFGIFLSDRWMFGFDEETGEQCGLGFDDKCGVYFALEMLRKVDVVKVFLSKDEEIGAKGTGQANMQWFEDASLCIQLDRRSYTNDVTDHTNGVEVLSKEFKKVIRGVMSKYDYSFNEGVFTDVGQLKIQGLGCICFNQSVGYFQEHSDQEVLSLNHFYNAINLGYEIITTFGMQKWKHILKVPEPVVGRIAPEDRYQLLKDYKDDWYDDPIEEDVWHYTTDGYDFSNSDQDYIDDSIGIGECPLCTSTHITDLIDGETHCFDCESTFNIPVGKGLHDIEEELEYYVEGKY